MDSGKSNPGSFSAYSVDDGIIQQLQLDIDGARLIAPSITKEGKIGLSRDSGKPALDGFDFAIGGAYPLALPVLDLKSRIDEFLLVIVHKFKAHHIHTIHDARF